MNDKINDSTLTPEILEFIGQCEQKPHSKSYLIAVLHKVQGQYGYLSQEHMDKVAHLLQVPTAIVSGVATFYHFFRLKPRGKFAISVCLGTACFVNGADKVLAEFRKELGIETGETSPDGLFSIETSRCLGVCAMAPVVTINERVFSNVTPKKVSRLIQDATDGRL
ncbi:NADH-quinone oxidoreductase subunit NuoE [bacterium]|nr:NADH-quinone oxidoreductase subunit NuoE [bacterium]